MVKIDKKMELDNCVFAKMVLMLCVLVYHCALFWSGNWFTAIQPSESNELLGLLSGYLGGFHTYGFVLISGYIYAYGVFECGKYQIFSELIINKAKRLIIPYIFVSIIWVIPISAYFFRYDNSTLFIKYALGVSPSQLWFLLCLFDIFVLAYFMTRLIINDYIYIGLFTFVIGVVGAKLIPNYFQIWTAFRYFPFFIAGMLLRLDKLNFLRKIPVIIYPILYTGLFLIYEVAEGSVFTLVIGFALNIVGALAAFFVLQRLAPKSLKKSPLLSLLASCSMTIYMFHQQVIYFVIYILNGRLNSYIIFLINIAVSLAISIAISMLLNEFKTTRFLIGEKVTS